MATRFEERLAQTRLQSRPHVARSWRAAIGDAAFRERLHGGVLILASVVGVATGGLVVNGLGALAGIVMGIHGLHLWRR
jgi:hypothetical protein